MGPPAKGTPEWACYLEAQRLKRQERVATKRQADFGRDAAPLIEAAVHDVKKRLYLYRDSFYTKPSSKGESAIQFLIEGLALSIKRLLLYRGVCSIYTGTPFIQGSLPSGSPIQFLVEGLALSIQGLLLYKALFQKGYPIQFLMEKLILYIKRPLLCSALFPKGSPIQFLTEGLALFVKRLFLYRALFQRGAHNSL